ncbi:malate:quinone oxidoreductase [Flavobacterium sp. MFBS3-15]|uniref:malate:quinone oxidoreductase n=1 Tax=Flavobacterium sp. MFBS3-15 TaxID=2989816 RepID=UPI0022362BCC|nr:malate:quinone oxidoreductase [Flavobacterium sp. MFBS3-15]MCW4468356.1 malate:quinone oxidoreductase [Flavobacterium sp. MFBS3-15]
MSAHITHEPDVVLIGAGIMSATLGMFLKELMPEITIDIYERLDVAAAESSDAWNNAGTGHSAFCELNYTPEKPDGSIDTSKAVKIAESFEQSKQFWAHLVEKGLITNPEEFVKTIPHMSFVWGAENVEYLKKRHEALQKFPIFGGMEYTEDPAVIAQWMPLVMEGREPGEPIAATNMPIGTDVNFGELTRDMFGWLGSQPGVNLHFSHEVRGMRRSAKAPKWKLKIKNLETGEKFRLYSKFIFIGAGGGSLHLLEKADIPEGKGYGGFPVSGQWLKCVNPEVIAKHNAKVYGKASVGAPPMSVPHIDTRMINGKKELLFGPYAGFSTKFLKNGSYLDLPTSIQFNNIGPMLAAGYHNMSLTKYLIDQVMQSPEDRLEALKEYLPDAKMEDWKLEVAGQRVQVIKKDEKEGGKLEFGTEVINSADGSLAVLLGASPGASTAVSIMLELMERCFAEQMKSPEWQNKLREMIPSYGQSLNSNPSALNAVRHHSAEVLGLAE